MEIKKGDKVRVSKDAPKVYLSSVNNLFKYHAGKVEETDGDSAKIRYTDIGIDRWLAIPTKYLVKVDAEAKEAKFKVGDRVVCNGYVGTILNEDDSWIADCGYWHYDIKWEDGTVETLAETELELYIEPTEQTEVHTDANEQMQEEYMRFMINMCEVHDARIRQMEAELDEFRKAELDRILHPEKPTFEVTIDNVAMNWQRYEADLAKELAIAYGKRGKSPLDAVATAKEITKRLKQK